MIVEETILPGVKIISLDVHRDARGYFVEAYNASRYAAAGIDAQFVQDNESCSQRGVVRGLHWQCAPWGQAQLIRVIRGAVLDVVVDVRRNSPTFGRYLTVELSAENGRQLFVPRGLAHGFVVLADETIFSYKCDNVYHPEAERGLRYDDPTVAIPWPDVGRAFVLSPKDLRHPFLAEIEPYEEEPSGLGDPSRPHASS
jgi:dTDP-4-dehydrorhamnose 3,5-epimerase